MKVNFDDLEMALGSLDPLYGKQIYVSGIHESKKLLLVDNDTDESYGIVSIERKKHLIALRRIQ